MSINFESAVMMYLQAKDNLAPATRKDYRSTLKKWLEWGMGVELNDLERSNIRGFLDWVYQKAIRDKGTNPGRTSNKARENLRAIMSWCWEHDLLDVAGRHYLTKSAVRLSFAS